ncbi:MAG: hypothetical protein ABI193_07290, partial [Minicystis sp.]
MVDVAVALPEPRPEDDEDVIWGLSTASALWLRGERRDAIVWLRRAAGAAISAGQGFRGSELGLYASDLEQALDEAAAKPLTRPPPALSTAPQALSAPPPAKSSFTEPTLPSAPGLRGLDTETRSAPPPERAPIDEMDLEAPFVPPPLRLIPPPPPAPTFSPSAFSAAPSAVAPAAAGSSSYRPPPSVTPPSNHPPPAGGTSSYQPPPPAPKPAAPTTSSVLPPPTGARSTTITPPPPPVMASQRLALPPPNGPVERHTPMNAAVISGAPPPPTGQLSAALPSIRKAQPRPPILDPWTEEPAQPSSRTYESIRVAQATSSDEVIVSRRKRTNTRNDEDEEEVVTSAVPLHEMLGRKVQQPPPTPTRKPTIPDSLPGHLAHAAPAVPSKAPTSDAKPALPPPVPPAASVAPIVAPPVPAPAAPIVAPPVPAAAPAAPIAAPPVPTAAPAALAVPRVAPPVPSTATAPSVPPPAPAKVAARPAPPPATPSKAPPPPAVAPAEPPSLGSVPLEDVDPFGDLPPDVQMQLVDLALTRTLAPDEAITGFGTALLLEGEATVTATGSEAPASRAVRGTLIPARGSISDAAEIRLVAGPDGATVASWDQSALEDALKSCPWVMEEITERAERLQSLAGATLGPLGEIDEISRNQLLDQLAVRVVHPRQAVAAQGEPLNGVALL